jgi:hypothetical protein
MATFELDHVAIAVHSIKDALRLFKDTLGGEYLMGGEIEPIWRWVQLSYPNGRKLELLEPLGEGFLTNFLDKRGEGLHHITSRPTTSTPRSRRSKVMVTSSWTSTSTTSTGRKHSCGPRSHTGRSSRSLSRRSRMKWCDTICALPITTSYSARTNSDLAGHRR